MQTHNMLTGPLFGFQKNIDNLSVGIIIVANTIFGHFTLRQRIMIIIIKTYILGGFREFDTNPPFSTKAWAHCYNRI